MSSTWRTQAVYRIIVLVTISWVVGLTEIDLYSGSAFHIFAPVKLIFFSQWRCTAGRLCMRACVCDVAGINLCVIFCYLFPWYFFLLDEHASTSGIAVHLNVHLKSIGLQLLSAPLIVIKGVLLDNVLWLHHPIAQLVVPAMPAWCAIDVTGCRCRYQMAELSSQ